MPSDHLTSNSTCKLFIEFERHYVRIILLIRVLSPLTICVDIYYIDRLFAFCEERKNEKGPNNFHVRSWASTHTLKVPLSMYCVKTIGPIISSHGDIYQSTKII